MHYSEKFINLMAEGREPMYCTDPGIVRSEYHVNQWYIDEFSEGWKWKSFFLVCIWI